MSTTGLRLLPLEAATYQPHPLHASERTWTETNCYVDLWIEVLHSLGLDPVAAAAFTLSSDFEGDQWTFFKFPSEDLRELFGLEVAEMNVWRPVLDHVTEQLEMGRLVTMEADSWFLPDTEGVSYRIDHVKSAIVPNSIDRADRRLGYFHNAGYFELEGDDFDGLFRLGPHESSSALPPYVETIRLDRMRTDPTELIDRVVMLTKEHLARRPLDDPMHRFEERLQHDLAWLKDESIETFHLYAFGTCRQCGAAAELAASFAEWLGVHDRSPAGLHFVDTGELASVVDSFQTVSTMAKSVQFGLARLSRGRSVDLHASFDEMSRAYERAMAGMVSRYGE